VRCVCRTGGEKPSEVVSEKQTLPFDPIPRRHLDEGSRRTLRGFGGRISFLVILALLWTSVLKLHSFGGLCHAISVCFTMASLGAFMTAIARREKPGIGALNTWDESLAFTAIAAFSRLLQTTAI